MPTVYDLTGEARQLAEAIEDLGDEPTEAQLTAIHAAVDGWELATADKAEALVRVLRAMDAHIAIAAEDQRAALAAMRYWRAQRERVRELADHLVSAHEELTGEGRIRATSATMWRAERTSYVYPDSIDDWPDELVTVETVRKPSRTAAKALIDAGEAPEGFGSRVSRSLTVRVRK